MPHNMLVELGRLANQASLTCEIDAAHEIRSHYQFHTNAASHNFQLAVIRTVTCIKSEGWDAAKPRPLSLHLDIKETTSYMMLYF